MDINLPKDFTDRMKLMLGDEFDDFLRSYENDNVHGLRLNPLKGKGNADALGFSLEQVPWCISGFYYSEDERPGKHPYHEAGAYYIQEPSAMLVGELAAVKPGEIVLDLCAAPGGKTTHLAGMLKGEGLLVSNEIHPARAKILSQNVERMGIKNCVVTNEPSERLAERFLNFFDCIVVDAPCSGEGMFRKNADACNEWSLENVKICADRQQDILNQADRMLKAGGRIVYSTCTFAAEEDEQAVERFLEEHEDYIIERVELSAVGDLKHGMPSKGNVQFSKTGLEDLKYTFRLWPHKLHGEGHFAAVLKKSKAYEDNLNGKAALYREALKSSAFDKDVSSGKKKKNNKGTAASSGTNNLKAAAQLFEEFSAKYLKKNISGRYTLFGDNLYIVPEAMIDISGLKVLRPGIQLGTIKKNRFEPSHALALSFKDEDARNVINISSEDERIYAYLRGESIEAEALEGWTLVCVDGYSLGWGKASNGILKNHYPKGLRWN